MEIKILTWNVWYKEKPENILNVLRQYEADILCLQELTQTSEFNPDANVPSMIADGLALNAAFYVAQTWIEDGVVIRDQGNGIFSKYPIRSKRRYPVQKSGGGNPKFDDEGRDYIEADIDINGTILTVATAHMSYTHGFQGSLKRDAENKALLSHIGRDRSNYLFTGDLNATPRSDIIEKLPKETNLRITSPPYAENTWTTKPFSYEGFTAETLAYRLDYAFASIDIKVLRTEVIQTKTSDHLPILITIQV